jgi:hypothetical protein
MCLNDTILAKYATTGSAAVITVIHHNLLVTTKQDKRVFVLVVGRSSASRTNFLLVHVVMHVVTVHVHIVCIHIHIHRRHLIGQTEQTANSRHERVRRDKIRRWYGDDRHTSNKIVLLLLVLLLLLLLSCCVVLLFLLVFCVSAVAVSD